MFEAVKDRKILVTVKYTDKSAFIPDHFVTSYIYDFGVGLEYIVGKVINEGKTGGYYKVESGKACYVLTPLENVPKEVSDKAEEIIKDIIEGKITVEYKPILPKK